MAKTTVKLEGKVIIPPDPFTKAILQGVVENANKIVQENLDRLVESVKQIIEQQIRESTTILSLTDYNGKLRSDFGLNEAEAHGAVEQIVNYLLERVKVEFKPYKVWGMRITGNLEITILEANLNDLADATFGQYLSTSKRGSFEITWLQWLLKAGDVVIIPQYNVLAKSNIKSSRSGLSIMVEGLGSFRMDPNHSGTPRNNFITRAIEDGDSKFSEAFDRHILSKLR